MLVVIDKDMKIEKCMSLHNDQEMYQECKDQTKSIHAKVLKTTFGSKISIGPNSNINTSNFALLVITALLPDSLVYQKIHKTSTYKLAKFLTRIIQQYCGNNFSFVKVSKGLAKSLRDQKVAPYETLVSFNVSALFTSIPVTVALEVINRKFTEHMNQDWMEYLIHTKGKAYLPSGISTKQTCPLFHGKILLATPRSCNGFTFISSHCQYLYGIF